MGLGDRVATWARAAARILDLAARPVRTAQGREGIVLQPYRGYGSRREVFLIGRVFRQSAPDGGGTDRLTAQLRDIGRRIARRAVAAAPVTARLGGAERRVETDRDGYFRIHLDLKDPPPADRPWHPMELRLEGEHPVQAEGPVFIPPEHCRFVVISDIDDTIMHTGVANKLAMLWRLFVEDAESRMAFPGVAALYRALHGGATGGQCNPMLYVSRAPWGIYDVLDTFFRLHGVPVGPVLFLREWGVSWRSPLPRRAEDHKQALIRNMLDLYHDLPFVLIGDSGQHDPEVYRQIVEENPGRVLAVLIRNVSRGEGRVREIEGLAMAVARAGSTMLLAADSAAMAEQAERLALVPPGTTAAVRQEMTREGGERTPSGTRRVRRPTPRGTAKAVAEGALRDAIDEGTPAAPPNVVVEAEDTARKP
ncbi:App1 family protein [Azospirillum sp.]|uniref:App1 family protein n=1 Tax=Azospirillum sp. TaxID=34012 RepID=UPI002D7038C5|nr:phosphatase domain-containing protein [Azospirillum sp.]HYD65443.1 phosphatase domain-containing protein [Azospirillum sp.]